MSLFLREPLRFVAVRNLFFGALLNKSPRPGYLRWMFLGAGLRRESPASRSECLLPKSVALFELLDQGLNDLILHNLAEYRYPLLQLVAEASIRLRDLLHQG